LIDIFRHYLDTWKDNPADTDDDDDEDEDPDSACDNDHEHEPGSGEDRAEPAATLPGIDAPVEPDFARHAADEGTTKTRVRRRVRPHINLLVREESWRERKGHGLTANGSLLSMDTIERLACDCTISRIVLDQEGMPVDIGRTSHNPTAAQRRALYARDHHCRFPGCRRRAQHTDAHHIKMWTEGGRTDLDNMLLLCWRHHRLVHTNGWNVQLDRDGYAHWTKPDGTKLKPDPPPTLLLK
jgi:hypothetical protein